MTRIRFAFVLAALLTATGLAHAQGAQDFSKVQIQTTKVTDKFFTLQGQGGTIGVLVGPDGVFMVDTQFAPLSEKIAAAIKDAKMKKVQAAIQGEQVRVTSPSRDDLQEAMALLRGQDFGVELKFGNYR